MQNFLIDLSFNNKISVGKVRYARAAAAALCLRGTDAARFAAFAYSALYM
jgi:hypothetical protein